MASDNIAYKTKKVHALTSIYVTDNTAQAGTARDVTGFDQLAATVMFGNVTASAAETITVILEAGDQSNGSDAAAITACTTGAITVANAIDNSVQAVFTVDLKKLNKKYVRAKATLSAVTTLMNCVVVFDMSGRNYSISPTAAVDYPLGVIDGN
jgi:hypothetical protein